MLRVIFFQDMPLSNTLAPSTALPFSSSEFSYDPALPALDFARSQRLSELVLNTYPSMQRAHRFYERHGFTRMADEGEMFAYQRNLQPAGAPNKA